MSWNSHRWTSLCNLKPQNNRSLWRGPHYTRYTISRNISIGVTYQRIVISRIAPISNFKIWANYISIILNIIIVIQLITTLNPLFNLCGNGRNKTFDWHGFNCKMLQQLLMEPFIWGGGWNCLISLEFVGWSLHYVMGISLNMLCCEPLCICLGKDMLS